MAMAPHEHLVTVGSLLTQQGLDAHECLLGRAEDCGLSLSLSQDHCCVTLPVSLPSVLHGLMYHTRQTVLHPQATTALLAALASVKGMSNLPLLGVLPCIGVVLFWSSFMPRPTICLGFSVAN